MKQSFTPERGEEVMRELQAEIADDDTAALVLIRVQAPRGTTGDASAELLHVVDAQAGLGAVAKMVMAAAKEFCGRLEERTLGPPKPKYDA